MAQKSYLLMENYFSPNNILVPGDSEVYADFIWRESACIGYRIWFRRKPWWRRLLR